MTTVEHEERGGESTSLLDGLVDLRPAFAVPVIVLVITIAWIAGVAH
jgi:hypothetical protein